MEKFKVGDRVKELNGGLMEEFIGLKNGNVHVAGNFLIMTQVIKIVQN